MNTWALLTLVAAEGVVNEDENVDKELRNRHKIDDADQRYPQGIESTSSLPEGESFTIRCHADPQGIYTIWWQPEATAKGYTAKRQVFQMWNGDTGTAGNLWKERAMRINAQNVNQLQVQIRQLTLKDEGVYYCEKQKQGAEYPDWYAMQQLIMWAKPTPPQIDGKDYYYSNEVTNDGTSDVDFSKEQNILECRTTKAFPKPRLEWLDHDGRPIQTGQPSCHPNGDRPELWDCSLELKTIVYSTMNQLTYTCRMEHETLPDGPQLAKKTLNVLYPPIDTTIKGNRTTKEITCSGRGNPPPKFQVQIGQTGLPMDTNDKGVKYIENLSALPENDLIYCYADNGLKPVGKNHGSIGDLFAAEPILSSIHWIIIASVGGALLVVGIILIACCCCNRNKDSFDNRDKKKKSNRGGYQPGQNGSMNMTKHYGQATMASNVSYNFRQPDGQEDPRSQVEQYIARAQSKEQLMADYDHASSHPSEVYHDQLARTRDVISRSREQLDHIEEQSAIEVTNRDLRQQNREDSFDETPPPYPPSSNQYNNQYAQSQAYSSQGGYGYDDAHLYQNDPSQVHQGYHEDNGPPPPPRNQSYRLV